MMFRSEEEIRALVRKFEACELALPAFSHAAHVVVGTVFVRDDAGTALERMRAGLLRFTAHYGKTGVYSEDVTREWIERIQSYVAGRKEKGLLDIVNGAVAEFATRSIKNIRA
jgi:hypothetical protein